MYDLIGDIHGHATELKQLLTQLHYAPHGKGFRHPEGRKALFVGDYIDRGGEVRETLAIVRAMVDAGDAIALMGNHEYNAMAFHQQASGGGHLRPHLIKNIMQHYATLKAFKGDQRGYEDFIDWCFSLPLWYEDAHLRAVHATWDDTYIALLDSLLDDGHRLNRELLAASTATGSAFCNAIEVTLKGKELPLPQGQSFWDKDGHERHDIRIKWWLDPHTTTYRELAIQPIEGLPDALVDMRSLPDTRFYQANERPVFFGHYWLRGTQQPFAHHVCCLDYSVAKRGHLVAYRFEAGQPLDAQRMVSVPAVA